MAVEIATASMSISKVLNRFESDLQEVQEKVVSLTKDNDNLSNRVSELERVVQLNASLD